jgi:hypothetical protein
MTPKEKERLTKAKQAVAELEPQDSIPARLRRVERVLNEWMQLDVRAESAISNMLSDLQHAISFISTHCHIHGDVYDVEEYEAYKRVLMAADGSVPKGIKHPEPTPTDKHGKPLKVGDMTDWGTIGKISIDHGEYRAIFYDGQNRLRSVVCRCLELLPEPQPAMTKEEFLSTSLPGADAEPCNCGDPECPGWKEVSPQPEPESVKEELEQKSHMAVPPLHIHCTHCDQDSICTLLYADSMVTFYSHKCPCGKTEGCINITRPEPCKPEPEPSGLMQCKWCSTCANYRTNKCNSCMTQIPEIDQPTNYSAKPEPVAVDTQLYTVKQIEAAAREANITYKSGLEFSWAVQRLYQEDERRKDGTR